MANVVLARTNGFEQEDINEIVARALNLLNYDFSQVDSVIIKPNLMYYWDRSTGETTDPRVVSAIIDYLRQINEKMHITIAEADASSMKTKYSFIMLGYDKLSRDKDVGLLNLSEGEILEKEVIVKGKKLVLAVNKALLDSDLVFNVPKLKYHRVQGITCSLKNMFGAISTPRKFGYHSDLSRFIVGVNKIVRSSLVVVDGIIAYGKTPKKMGVIIGSDDALAADFVAARILGYNPYRIAHLNLARKEKVGDDKPNLIENGTTLKEVGRDFPRQSYLSQKVSWGVQIRLLKAYARIVGDVVPPVLEEG